MSNLDRLAEVVGKMTEGPWKSEGWAFVDRGDVIAIKRKDVTAILALRNCADALIAVAGAAEDVLSRLGYLRERKGGIFESADSQDLNDLADKLASLDLKLKELP